MITACIVELQAAGYGETAEILAIARLDLLARLHGVSEEELEFLISGPSAAGAVRAPKEVVKPWNIPAKAARKKTVRKQSVQNKSG
ncbi:MAG: hypothetical protein P4L57_10395 [Rhizomicrobium sp.]|nr:hypothetical protein [Rhizomicrobium sp.]